MSRTIATPSSRSVRSAFSTWTSQLLPTKHTVSVPASRRSRRVALSSAFSPALRVIPNATSSACCRVSFVARRKNSVSRGFAPGQPPSM